jgi:hypothetical protein
MVEIVVCCDAHSLQSKARSACQRRIAGASGGVL